MSHLLARIAITIALVLAALGWASGPVHPAHASCSGVVTLEDLVQRGTGGSTILPASYSCFGWGGTVFVNDDVNFDMTGEPQGVAYRFVISSGVRVTLKNLTSDRAHSTGVGGSIDNQGTLIVTNSTFSSDSASGDGGAIYNQGTLTVTNSTFSGNASGGVGGAIDNLGTLRVTNSTFSGNAGTGGGDAIYNNTAGTVTLANTILAGSSSGNNCAGSIADGRGNFSDDGSCNFSAASTNNATGLNLGPLADNGGPTWTIALLPGSAAIDVASCLQGIDQRGAPRPDPGDTNQCDAGAYESGTTLVSLSTCSEAALTNAITAATAVGAVGMVRFTRDCTIPLSSTIGAGQDVTIDGNGHKVTLNGGGGVQVFAVNSGVTAALNDLTITGGSAGGAGGIGNAGTLTVSNSTVTGNSCLGGGDCAGGIYNTGALTVINSTIAGNSGGGGATGGITNAGTLAVTNSTVSSNSGAAGGILIDGPSAVTTFTNTILSGNGSDCGFFQSSQPIIDNGGNLADDNTCGFIQSNSKNSASNLNLGSLADNGGPTRTIDLLPGSAAIDFAGANCPRTDQRGIVRPDDADDNGACDSGAVEGKELFLQNVPGDIVVAATSPAGAAVNFPVPTVVDQEGQSVSSARVVCGTPSGTLFPITPASTFTEGSPALPVITCTVIDSAFTNSLSYSFTVTVLAEPAITGITPTTGLAGSAASTLTLSGTGFVTGSAAYLYLVSTGHVVHLTTSVDSWTQLTVDIPANLAAGATLITVKNVLSALSPESNHWPWIVTTSPVTLAGTPSIGTAGATTGGSSQHIAGAVTIKGSDLDGTAFSAVGVALYASNPGGPLLGASGAYFDAFVLPPSLATIDPSFSHYCFTITNCPLGHFPSSAAVTIVDCNLNGGNEVQWWNGTAWVPASDQTYNTPAGCVTITVNNTTTPNLTQLSGTPFGAATPDTDVSLTGVPTDKTVEATGSAGAAATFTLPTAVDEAGETPPVTCQSTGGLTSGSTFPLGATTVTCSATDSDDSNSPVSQSFTVTVQDTTPPTLTLPANITAEASDLSGAAVSYTATASDLVDGTDAVSCTPTSGWTFTLGTTTVNCSATDKAGNTATGSFTVTVTPPSIAVTVSGNQTYGSSSPSFTPAYNAPAGVTVGGGVSCTTVNGGSAIGPALAAAGTYTIDGTSCSGLGATGYIFGYTGGSFVVAPAPLTITAKDQSMTYGDTALPDVTRVGYSGFVAGDSPSQNDLQGTLSCALTDSNGATVTISSNLVPGTYTDTCAGQTSNNYSITYKTGTLTVKPAPLSFTVNASMTYGDAVPTLIGLNMTSTSPAVSFSGFVNGQGPGVVSGTTADCATTAAPKSSTGTYIITGCDGFSASNYSISFDSAHSNLTITRRAITVTAKDHEFTYGGTVPTWTASVTTGTLVNGDALTSLGVTCGATDGQGHAITASTAAGTYTNDITCAGGNTTNYAYTYKPGTLTIDRAPLSFTVNASMTYGGAVPALNALATSDGKVAFSGFVNGESAGVVSGQTASCATTASSTTNVGSYPITGCTGFTASNYTITLDSGHSTVTINKASTSVSLTSSLNPAMSTHAVTFTATMSVLPPGGGTPTGTVAFFDGSLSLGAGTRAVVNGKVQVTLTTSSLGLGAHSITASYGGDTNFKSSDTTASPLTQYIDTNLSGFPKLSSGAYNLQNASLPGAYLVLANLAGANASNATLTNANLTSVNLSGANLSQAILSGATMSKANLTNANLSQANLKGATGLSTATLTGVIWSKTTCPDGTLSNNDGGSCTGHF